MRPRRSSTTPYGRIPPTRTRPISMQPGPCWRRFASAPDSTSYSVLCRHYRTEGAPDLVPLTLRGNEAQAPKSSRYVEIGLGCACWLPGIISTWLNFPFDAIEVHPPDRRRIEF